MVTELAEFLLLTAYACACGILGYQRDAMRAARLPKSGILALAWASTSAMIFTFVGFAGWGVSIYSIAGMSMGLILAALVGSALGRRIRPLLKTDA